MALTPVNSMDLIQAMLDSFSSPLDEKQMEKIQKMLMDCSFKTEEAKRINQDKEKEMEEYYESVIDAARVFMKRTEGTPEARPHRNRLEELQKYNKQEIKEGKQYHFVTGHFVN